MSSTQPTNQLDHTNSPAPTNQLFRHAPRLHTRRIPLRVAALLATVALMLGACGNTSGGNSPQAGSESPQTSAPTDIPGSPTVAEVKEGFAIILDDGLSQLNQEITDEVRENYTQCLANETYNNLSPEGRETIANLGDDAAIANPDRVVISQASTTCRKHIDKLIIPGSDSTISRSK